MQQMMKYFIVESKEPQLQEFFYDIADFLWDNDNTVYLSSHYDNDDVQRVIQNCDWVVLTDIQNTSFHSAKKAFQNEWNLKTLISKKNSLIFLNNGVYTNVIPFPYKIFHFDTFSKDELKHFFNWCQKLHLFQKSLIDDNYEY